MSVSSLETKLNQLNKNRKKLNPSGSRTKEVKSCLSKLESAFESYIKSDNISTWEVITQPFSMVVEEHSDFTTAIGYIDRAISATKAAIEWEKAAEAAKKGKEG